MKNNLKMKLISEYIYLLQVTEKSKNLHPDCDFLMERVQRLTKIYKKIFFKIGLFNLSLAILQKENEKMCLKEINKSELLKNICKFEENLEFYFDKMKLNEFEKRYVTE